MFSADQSRWINDGYRTMIIPSYIDDVKPIYQIDTYGTIINTITNFPIIPHVNDHGYWFVSLMTNSGTGRVYRKLHRMVLMSFNYVPGCEVLHANHKDGNKRMNHLDNLEWMTPKENKNHGVQNKKEHVWFRDHDPALILDRTMIRQIGDMILSNIRMDYIIRAYPVLDVPTVHNIAMGNINPGIFSAEEIEMMSIGYSTRSFTDTQARKICEFLQLNKNTYFASSYDRNTAALQYAGLPDTPLNRVHATSIYCKRQYIPISRNYDF